MKTIIKSILIAFAVALCAAAQPNPFPLTVPSIGYSFEVAFPGVSMADPYGVQFIGTLGNKVYWASRDQRLSIITNLSAPNRTTMLNNQAVAVADQDTGMPGIVQHPGDPTRWYSWAGEKDPAGSTNLYDTLREWKVSQTNPYQLLPSRMLIRQIDRTTTHLGGGPIFGKDGYLYIFLSDEGGQGDPYRNSQRIDLNFFGAVMRIDVDNRPGNLPPNPHPSIVIQTNGLAGYLVPSDNPYIGATSFNGSPVDPANVRTEFYMVGLRNPNTVSMDSVTGDIYIGDVGGSLWESVRKVVRGGNAGWAAVEGESVTTFLTGSSTVSRPPENFAPPVWSYPHPGKVPGWDPQYEGICIFIGPVVHGTRYPDLEGHLIVSDVTGAVWALKTNSSDPPRRIATLPSGATSWSVDPVTGHLLAGSFYGKNIYRMVPATQTAIPATLSATGLFSDLATLTPAGAIPYEVNSPFWSDDADKYRWFLFQSPSHVTRDASDSWTLPTGAITIKQINADGYRVETRIMVKTATSAYGLSYRWRPDGLDADLASPYGEDVPLPTRNWHIPSWTDCMQCHTPVVGYSPGFRTAQLNRDGQLEALSAAGLIYPPITNASALPKLVPILSSAPVSKRFKSYLDANCSQCHQPGGTGRGTWDARFTTPRSADGIIDGPVSDTLGIEGARVIASNDTARSVILRRLKDQTEFGFADYHMPPLATARLNTNAVLMVEEYIASLAPRTNWTIGTPGSFSKYSQENNKNDPPPGSPLVMDDDFYTAGDYPSGFNGLLAHLEVDEDEPLAHWERALALRDSTNRIHLVTSAGPATITIGLLRGAAATNGVFVTPPIHNVAVVHKSQDGSGSVLGTYQVSANTTLSMPFQASEGPQTIELIRTGPPWPFYSSAWVNFDSILISKP